MCNSIITTHDVQEHAENILCDFDTSKTESDLNQLLKVVWGSDLEDDDQKGIIFCIFLDCNTTFSHT